MGQGRPQQPSSSPEHQLLAAIILQALSDALAGDREAAYWMDYYAPDIAYLWLGMEPCLIARWREVRPDWPSTSPVYRTALRFSRIFGGKYAQDLSAAGRKAPRNGRRRG